MGKTIGTGLQRCGGKVIWSSFTIFLASECICGISTCSHARGIKYQRFVTSLCMSSKSKVPLSIRMRRSALKCTSDVNTFAWVWHDASYCTTWCGLQSDRSGLSGGSCRGVLHIDTEVYRLCLDEARGAHDKAVVSNDLECERVGWTPVVIQWLCYAMRGILLAWFRCTCSLRGKWSLTGWRCPHP